jgi:hypothetical protein
MGFTMLVNEGVLTGRWEGIRDVVTAFSICLVVFGCASHGHAKIIRLEGSGLMGSRRRRMFWLCERPSYANPLVSGAVLAGPYVCCAGLNSRSRGDFIVQSCLPTRVGAWGERLARQSEKVGAKRHHCVTG